MTTYPSVLETLPTGISGSQSTASGDHHELHNDDNRVLNALMLKVGVDGSTDPASLDFLVHHLPSGTMVVDLIFDDHAHRLEDIATTATHIDGTVIANGYLVYVKDSSDPTEVGKIYLATVVGTAVTWTYSSTPAPGTLFYSNYGVVYGGNIYSATTIIVPGGSISNPKPSDLNASNAPTDLYVPRKKAGSDQFERVAQGGGGGSGTGDNYLILDTTLTGTTPVNIIDSRIADITPYLVFYTSQPAGTITKTLVNGQLTLVSDNAGDTMAARVLFRNIGPGKQYMKGTATLTGAGPWTITDPRITATTPAMIMPRTTPVGYLTANTGTGSMVIHSTGTEVGVVIDYEITLDTTNISDSMPYNATLNDNDMFFRKGSISGDDEAVKRSSMKVALGISPSPGGFDPETGLIAFTMNRNILKYAQSESIGWTDDFNYIPKGGDESYFGETSRQGVFSINGAPTCILSDGSKINEYNVFVDYGNSYPSPYYHMTGKALVSNGFLYAISDGTILHRLEIGIDNMTDATVRQARIYSVSGYALNGSDKWIGVHGGYIHIRRPGTTDVRRFTDSGSALVYVDTITLLWTPSDLWLNNYGYYDAVGSATVQRDYTTNAVIAYKGGNIALVTSNSVYCLAGSSGGGYATQIMNCYRIF